MRGAALLTALALVASPGASALELTKENWESATAGKTVFIKFQAPWCGHCKRMKPDWEKLMAAFSDSNEILVADVDCTAGGKALCNEVGVRGYPSIKYGAVGDLQDYKQGRSFADLKKFADGLGPQCGPANMDLCAEERKKEILAFQAMSEEERAELVKEKEAKIESVEGEYKAFVDALQKRYAEAQEKKDADLSNIRSGGLGLLKAVQASQQKKEL